MIIDGYTVGQMTGPAEFTALVEQDVFISTAGTVHASDRRAVDTEIVKVRLRGITEGEKALLRYLYLIKRASRDQFVITLDGEVSARTVNWWMGNRGFKYKKMRNDLFDVDMTFLQVGI